ncbi:MAG: kelch repeat-containing protein [Terracidiphilus sp.]|jgi:N-acetylneuraminic acid mutarotase
MRKVYVPVCAGMLFVVAAFLTRVFAQTPGEIIAYAGNGTPGSTGDGGPATSAELYSPTGITLDKSGNLYIADLYNQCIQKVTPSTGIITDVAGQCQSGIGKLGYSGDGGPATDAKLNFPTSIVFDSEGDLYFIDSGNFRIRKVDAATGVITTVAGNGADSDTGDDGPAIIASLMNPEFLAIDTSGNLYFTGSNDNVVRKVIVSTGIITRAVGTGAQGYTGDGGPATNAQLYSPFGVAFDSAGNLYIADQSGDVIREVSASTGIISTVVGDGEVGISGDGGLAKNATVNNVQGITFDGSNNMYIADEDNLRIRKVTAATQVITTVAGNYFFGTPTLNAPALQFAFKKPWGIAVDANDNFYISDNAAMQVYKVFAGGPVESTTFLSTQGTTPLSSVTSEVQAGQVFDLTTKVVGSLDSPAPTGTVTFYDTNTENTTTELGQVSIDSSGVVTFSLSLPDGNYQITATYSGDKTYFSSSSVATVEVRSQTAAAPTFAPAAGTYTYNLQVAIHDNTPGVTIMYTTDGTIPSATNGTPYAGAIPVTANTTIKAVATQLTYPVQYLNSPVVSATYVINLPSEAPLPQGQWAWESGASASTGGTGGCRFLPGYLGVFGVEGVPAPNNVPGARSPGANWTDNNGNFWIFGGETATGQPDYGCNVTNDLWMFNPTTKEWTWMSGSDTFSGDQFVSPAGVYGMLGKFAPANVPGGRAGSVTWTDKSGNLWLFGGDGYGPTEQLVSFNDLWEFNPATRQWAWMGGSNTYNQRGSYGTLHVANSGNIPGARYGAAGWTDRNGNFWMFGGQAYDSTANQGVINDLWEFNPSTRQWAWMGGSELVGQPGTYGYLHDPSTANIPGARVGGMTWVDKLGEFWFFGGDGLGATKTYGTFNDLWTFDPSNLTWTWAMGSAYGGTYGNPAGGDLGQGGVYGNMGVPDPGNTPGSRSGSATFTDAQGNLWLYGGGGFDSAGNQGTLDDLWEFDRTKWLWAWMGGHEVAPPYGVSPTYGTYRVPSSETDPGPRSGVVGFTDKNGNPWMFGGVGASDTSVQNTFLYNDLFEYQLP